MTQQDFDSLRFCAGMLAEYGGHWYKVISCNFPERLFDADDPMWVRCENVTQVKYANL